MSSRLHRLRLLVALLVTLLPLSWATGPTVVLAATSAAEAEAENESSESSGVTPGSPSLACLRAERRAAPPAPLPVAPLAPHRIASRLPARAPRLALAAERLPYRHWRRDNGIGRSLLM